MNQKLNKVLARILINEPFFASLLLRLNIQIDTTCKTMWTDGVTIGFNPDFIESIVPGEISRCNLDTLHTAIIHELQHLVSLHQFRRKGRDTQDWNIACDHVVNNQLKNFGYEIPKDWLCGSQYANLSEEAVYDQIHQKELDSPPSPSSNQSNNSTSTQSNKADPNSPDKLEKEKELSSGEIRDYPKVQSGNSEDNNKAMQEWVNTLISAHLSSKMQGKGSLEVERHLKEILSPKIPPQEILSRFILESVRGGFDYSRSNKRYPNFYLPRRKTKEIGNIVIAVDTSGSLDINQLSEFTNIIFGILETTKKLSSIKVIYCDYRITHTEELEPYMTPSPKGGGGTSYVPIMEYLKEESEDYKGLIYFTDGQCADFGQPPDLSVLWVITPNNPEFLPPYGEVVYL